MNKLTSGIVAIGIYLGLIFLILLYYNVHEKKAKNYVEKNANRITVTLVNSDKTVFNKSSKVTTPTKPIQPPKVVKAKKTPTIPTPPPKKVVKKTPPKVKDEPKKLVTPTKKEIKAKEIASRKKLEEEKIARAKARREKDKAKRLIAQEKEDKKRIAQAAKEREKKKKERIKEAAAKEQEQKKAEERKKAAQVKKEKEKKRLAQIKAEEDRKKRAKERKKNLFASVNTNPPKKRPKATTQPSRIKHTSTVADRIKETHQSGQASNRNREKGVENAYIAKVQKQLNNWNAQSNYKGQSAKIKLTIMSSGHFRYTINRSSSGALSSGLRDFMEQLNRIGLGRHDKSSPYVISVTFRAR